MPATEQAAPVGLLTNPASYRNRNARGVPVDELLRGHTEIRRFEVSDRAAIRAAVEQLAADGAGLVLVDGGDGTVQGVIAEVCTQSPAGGRPWVGILPGGRTNVVSRDINGNCDRRRAFERILQRYRAGDRQALVQRHALSLQWHDRAPEYGFLVSAGGLAAGIEECWEVQRRLGRFGRLGGLGTAVWIARRLLAARPGRPLMPPRRGRIKVDEAWLPPHSFQTVLATTHRNFPLGICPFWGQGAGPMRVTAVAAETRGLWWRFVPLILGRARLLPEAYGYCSRNAESLEMELEESFHLDGEQWTLQRPATLRIETGPRIGFLPGSR